MRLLNCIFLALLSFWMANPSEAGRHRNRAEPVMVYFPPTPGVNLAERYVVQIPWKTGWRTVYEVGQGECIRNDRKLVGATTPYWLRTCWKRAPTLCAEAVDGDGSISEADCLAIFPDDEAASNPVPPQPTPGYPLVMRQRVLDCTTGELMGEAVASGATVELLSVSPGDCIGVLTDGDAETASIGYDFTSTGAQTAQPFSGERSTPFGFPDENGTTCWCPTDRPSLSIPGEHTLTVTPCSVDPPSWGTGSKATQCTAAGGVAGEAFSITIIVP